MWLDLLCVFVPAISIMGGFFFFKQKTAYEMRISDWSSDVCSSDLFNAFPAERVTLGGYGLVNLTAAYDFSKNASIQVRWNNLLDKIGRASCRERVCQYV